MNKRSYALSKEAGRKAAKWVRDQHADLFQHEVAEPPIEVSEKPYTLRSIFLYAK